jgi:hypothetical protein
LLAIGLTGKLQMYSKGSDVPRLTVDIVGGAGLTVSESPRPRFRAFVPFDDEEDSPANVAGVG